MPFIRGSKKVLSECVQLGQSFFLVDEGKDAQNTYTTIIGPSLARQQNAISMAFHWRADDGPTLNAGLVDL